MSNKIGYKFSGKVWQYNPPSGWHFVSLPHELAHEIRAALKSEEEGWGRLKVEAVIGNSKWKTSIWFDTKMNTYLLPVKTEIRRKESIKIGVNIELGLFI